MSPHPESAVERNACVIAGGSSGIGLAVAELLLQRGIGVVIIDRDPPPNGLGAEFVRGDVCEPATWDEASDRWNTSFGGLTYAFLNAGVQSPPAPVIGYAAADWQRTLAVNLGAVITGTIVTARAIAARGRGGIVLTSSLAGLLAYPPDPVYAATKHGVVGFGRAMAHQLRSQNVRINVVCPGLTDTGFLTQAQRDDIDVEDFPLIPSVDVAATTVELLTGDGTGGVWVCQYGREAIEYEPRGVPGPRNHRQPPHSLSQPRHSGV